MKIVKRSVLDSWNLDIPQDGTCSDIYMNFSLLFITCPETTASEIHRRLALTGAAFITTWVPARLCPDSPVRPPPGVWSEVQISKQPSENSGSGGLPGHAHNMPAPVSTQPLNTLRIPSLCAKSALARRPSLLYQSVFKTRWARPLLNATNKYNFMSAYNWLWAVTLVALEIMQDRYTKACSDLFHVQCTLDQSEPRSSS